MSNQQFDRKLSVATSMAAAIGLELRWREKHGLFQLEGFELVTRRSGRTICFPVTPEEAIAACEKRREERASRARKKKALAAARALAPKCGLFIGAAVKRPTGPALRRRGEKS